MIRNDHNDISSRPVIPATGSTTETTDGGFKKVKNTAVGEASNNRAKTSIIFDNSEHDFGNLKQGDNAEYSFRFTNTGKEPLIIEDAKGSCGCTVPSYPKEPIAPGANAEIKVKFSSANKSGPQKKTVTITANTEPITSTLTIMANVEVPAGNKSSSPKAAH
ncbi:MAG: DUF1573 domain-containing protein [Crocinitomicaceae bacterium]|nr:DUF1573 domain-containing protein [Crocinitomicaceae bacterium]